MRPANLITRVLFPILFNVSLIIGEAVVPAMYDVEKLYCFAEVGRHYYHDIVSVPYVGQIFLVD